VDTYRWTIGVDWGGAEHHICVMREDGEVVGTRVVAHTMVAVHEALRWITTVTGSPPADIAVAIETPRGILVDTLIEQGFAVWAINPKQLDRFRDRFSAGGAKDDPRDARVLADALRTDRRAFRLVRPDDPQIIYLRELCRMGEELQETSTRLANRLRDQLYRVNAAWLELSPAADEAWLWDLLSGAAHPDRWPRLSRTRVARVLKTHRIRRLIVEDVIAALRQPRLSAAPGVTDAVATRIESLVPQLLLTDQQRTSTERQIERCLDRLAAAPSDGEPREHRDVIILRSLPGVGRTVAATMLTEAAGPLAARDYPTLRAHSGTAPITKRSSKRTFVVHMRYACKYRLRNALYHWSRTSIQHDAEARAYYDRLRARGHHHSRALRSVADRWLRILVAMLRSGTVYDPTRFQQGLPTTS
jgi:transposase